MYKNKRNTVEALSKVFIMVICIFLIKDAVNIGAEANEKSFSGMIGLKESQDKFDVEIIGCARCRQSIAEADLVEGVKCSVCGKVVTMGQYEIDIQDDLFFNLVITNGFASPNEQTGDYFTISISNVFELPWVLDIPFPEPIKFKAKSKIKEFLKRVFKA